MTEIEMTIATNYVSATTGEISVLDDPRNPTASQDPAHDRRSPGHIRVVMNVRGSTVEVCHVEYSDCRPIIHGTWDGHGIAFTDQVPAWLAEHVTSVNSALRSAIDQDA